MAMTGARSGAPPHRRARARPTASGAPYDLRISASTRDFIALALRQEDPDALFFDRRLLMEGDTDLGLVVKNTVTAAATLSRSWPPARAGRSAPSRAAISHSTPTRWKRASGTADPEPNTVDANTSPAHGWSMPR